MHRMMETLNFKTQICTTIEQSKRLLELGLKPETSDMHHYKWSEGYWEIQSCPPRGSNSRFIPAWSLDRLITMLPYKVNKSPNNASLLEITRIKDNSYHVGYVDYKVVEMPLFEAVIRLIEELIKDNLFNKEYLNETK